MVPLPGGGKVGGADGLRRPPQPPPAAKPAARIFQPKIDLNAISAIDLKILLSECISIIQSQPSRRDVGWAWHYLGICYFAIGDRNEAASMLNRARNNGVEEEERAHSALQSGGNIDEKREKFNGLRRTIEGDSIKIPSDRQIKHSAKAAVATAPAEATFVESSSAFPFNILEEGRRLFDEGKHEDALMCFLLVFKHCKDNSFASQGITDCRNALGEADFQRIVRSFK